LVHGPPRQPGNKRDEPNETEILSQKAVVFAANTHQLLVAVILADRDDQDAAGSERVDQGRRDFPSRGSHEHSLVWRLLRPALCAVAESAHDIPQAQLFKSALCIAQQFAVTLDRKDPAAEGGQNRGLVARTCSDL
jgi:hypothetical protein